MSWQEVTGTLFKKKNLGKTRSRKKLSRNASQKLKNIREKQNFKEDMASFMTTAELPEIVRKFIILKKI